MYCDDRKMIATYGLQCNINPNKVPIVSLLISINYCNAIHERIEELLQWNNN